MNALTIEQTEGRPLAFIGELVRSVTGEASGSKQNTRQHVLELYRTEHGSWVLVIDYQTTFSSDASRRRAYALPNSADVARTLDAYDAGADVSGFPDAEQFERKKHHVVTDVRRKFHAAAQRLLSALPDLADTPPDRHWSCDGCGKPMASPEDARLEWLVWRGKPDGRGLRLVHDGAAHSTCRYDESLEYERGEGLVTEAPLLDFLGPDGLMRLIGMCSSGLLPTEEAAEMLKRLHVPWYEEARPHLGHAVKDGLIDLDMAPGCYSQAQLRAIISKYHDKAP